jgi:hypothetical protein
MKPRLVLDALATTCALALVSIGNAQTPAFLSAKRIASTLNQDDELAIGLAIDSAANLYATGWFDGTNDFGGTVLTNRGGQDVFVAKYDASGLLRWARRAGGATPEEDAGRGIGVDADGNVYVTGGFRGDADFGTNIVSAPLDTAFFLAKYDSAGTVQWVRQSIGSDTVYGTGLAVDTGGNCYAVGYFNNGQVVAFGTANLTSSHFTGYGTFLVKCDIAGQVQWARLLDSPQRCYSTSVAVDAGGDAYVPASFNNSLTLGGTLLTSTGGSDGLVARFNSAGVLQWVQQLTGAGDCGGFAVSARTAGSVHLVGGFGNAAGDTVSFGPAVTLTNVGGGPVGSGVGDAFLAKFESDSAAVEWALRAGGTNWDAFTGVSSDAQGNVYVGGGRDGIGLPGGFNVVVAKYDTDGFEQWTQSSTGTNGALVFAGPVLDASGNCYVAGWFQTNVVFGPHTLTGNGHWDYFLAKVGFTSQRPRLFIADLGSQAQLWWSNSSTYYDLQWSTDLDSWLPVSGAVEWNNNHYYATNPITSAASFFRLASRDPLTNSFMKSFEADNNIQDGVVIETNSYSFIVSQTNAGGFVIVFPDFGLELPVTRAGNALRNESGPIELPDSYLLEVLLLSDGVNKVFAFVGQEKSNPLDVSFNATCWSESSGNLKASDIVGTWSFQGYSDSNLGNTGDGFDSSQFTATITAVGETQVLISMPDLNGTATISGMEATLDNVPLNTGDSTVHTLKLASNGLGLALYRVATELDDPSDVSLRVMLGVKQ